MGVGAGWVFSTPQLHGASGPQRLLEWVDAAELRMAEEFLIGGDLDMVQQQLAELKVGTGRAAGAGTAGVGQVGAQDGRGVEMWDGTSAPMAPTHGGCWVAKPCPRRCPWKAQLLMGRTWGQVPVPGCAMPKQTLLCCAKTV